MPPVRASAYCCGVAWSAVVHHGLTGRRLLVVGSAGFVPGARASVQADVACLGVGQRDLQSERYPAEYWVETLRVLGRLAEEVGVSLHLPALWERTDPWS